MKNYAIVASLFLVVALASCSQNSGTSLNNGGGSMVRWTTQNIGTSYVFEEIQPNSKKPVIDTITILETGQNLGGKTGVVGAEDIAGTIGAFFYNIEQNGDISFGDSSFSTPSSYTWKTYPTASQQPISDSVIRAPCTR